MGRDQEAAVIYGLSRNMKRLMLGLHGMIDADLSIAQTRTAMTGLRKRGLARIKYDGRGGRLVLTKKGKRVAERIPIDTIEEG